MAELAADVRASTPSNAAEVLVPDRKEKLSTLLRLTEILEEEALAAVDISIEKVIQYSTNLDVLANELLDNNIKELEAKKRTLIALSPQTILKRGYTIVRKNKILIKSATSVKNNDKLEIQFFNGKVITEVQ